MHSHRADSHLATQVPPANRRKRVAAWLALAAASVMAAITGAPAPSEAQQLRFLAGQRGDIALIGNTVLHCEPGDRDCSAAQTGGGLDNNDYAMVVQDIDGDATTFDSTRATLSLPPRAGVTWAGLYWHCVQPLATQGLPFDRGARGAVRFAGPGFAYRDVVAFSTLEIGDNYQAFADVTALVASAGAGEYTVANIQCANRIGNIQGGFTLIVVYDDPTAALRTLAVYDGLTSYTIGSGVGLHVPGLRAPTTGSVRTTLGLVLYDGDRSSGDTVTLSSGAFVTPFGSNAVDSINPTDDVGNGTISIDGLDGPGRTPSFVNNLGFDIDRMTFLDALPNAATSLDLSVDTDGERIFLGAVTVANDLEGPELELEKTATDLNGGDLVRGDEILYVIRGRNVGVDNATSVVVRDPLPTFTEYVFDSIELVGAGAVTDAIGDDRGEHRPATNSVVVRVGLGADGTTGGTLAPGDEFELRFRARVTATAPGGSAIRNSARATYFGGLTGGSPEYGMSSDSNAGVPGRQPATLFVEAICGDGVITAPESCDGANTPTGRTCTALCRIGVDVASPPDGARIRDTLPSISGHADPGASVTVSLDGLFVATVTANAGGDYTVTPSNTLGEGTHNIFVRAVDTVDGVSTAMTSFVVDADAAATIDYPTDGAAVADSTPTFVGSADDDATIEVFVDGVSVGRVGAASTGRWAFELTTSLAEGPHTVGITSTDGLGNVDTTLRDDPVRFTVDTATDLLISFPLDGSTIDDRQPTIRGAAEPGARVDVLVDGNPRGFTMASTAGTFAFALNAALENGGHVVTCNATDAAGNRASRSAAFTLDAQTFIAIVSPADGATVRDTRPAIAGVAEANSLVTVTIDGESVGSSRVNASGVFSIASTRSLEEGEHTIVATARDDGGDEASVTQTFFVDTSIAVDLLQPGDRGVVGTSRPELSGRADPGARVSIAIDGSAIGEVTADAEGNFTMLVRMPLADAVHIVNVTAEDEGGNRATDDGFFRVAAAHPLVELQHPADHSHTREATPVVRGRAEPGGAITLALDGVVIGSTLADERGTFTYTPATTLTEGDHVLRAIAVDAAGARTEDQHTFSVSRAAPALSWVGPITGRATGDDTPTLTGTATAGVDVSVFGDGRYLGTTPTDSAGAWALGTIAGFTNGTHTFRVVARAAPSAPGGVATTATEAGELIIDTMVEATLDLPGAVSASDHPSFVGRTEPRANITILVDETEVGRTVAGDDGAFVVRSPSSFSAGNHRVALRAVDLVGNSSRLERALAIADTLTDSDGDGQSDTTECLTASSCADSDRDGVTDDLDEDDDDDGVPTALECGAERDCPDSDGDGAPDRIDADDDGDGVRTAVELASGRRDTDWDGFADHLDRDDDGDGVATSDELGPSAARDSDRDTVLDHVDYDDDDDGLPTALERADSAAIGGPFASDVDGDTFVNWTDADADGDTIRDRLDGIDDDDEDGIPNYLDGPRNLFEAGIRDGGVDGSAGPAPTGGFVGGGCGCSVPRSSQPAPLLGLLVVAMTLLARRRRRLLASLLALLAFSLPMGASAQDGPFRLDGYRPAETPIDGLAVSSARDLGHLAFGARLSLGYALNPLVYEARLGMANSESSKIVEHLLAADVGLSFGLFDRFVISVGMPVTLFSDGVVRTGFPRADGTQAGDPTIGLRARLFGEADDMFALSLGVQATLPLAQATSGTQTFSGERSATVAPRIIAELRPHERVTVRANLGVRIRERSTLFNLEIGNELTYGLGLSVAILPDVLEGIAETFGSANLETSPNNTTAFHRSLSPLELLLGLRFHADCEFQIDLAGGTGLSRGYGAPDFRGVLQVGYVTESVCRSTPRVAEPVETDDEGPSDRDHDGYYDADDRCPDDPEDLDNFEDEGGCPDPDNDGDGIFDVDDLAPNEPEDDDGFEDEDGRPDPDNDGDGIPDAHDGAPNDAEDLDGFADLDGVPDLDNDDDQVLDASDDCPFAPGRAEDRGCPRGVRFDPQLGTFFLLQNVEFANNRDVILDRSFELLREVRAILAANRQVARVRIEGHTDDRGVDARNMDLSRRRARAVRTWLVQNGVDPARLEAYGCGELFPVLTNQTDEGRQGNRRVEFHIVEPPTTTALHEGCELAD